VQEVFIDEKMKSWAISKKQAHKKGQGFQQKVNVRDSVYIGYLGEAVFFSLHRKIARHLDEHGFDFMVYHRKIETKAYFSDFPPKDDYWMQVTEKDRIRTDNDAHYCFICLMTNYDRAFLVGEIPVGDYKALSIFHKEGTVRPNSKFVFKTDTWEMQAKHLIQVSRRQTIEKEMSKCTNSQKRKKEEPSVREAPALLFM